ncbi:MAG: hypothetical protein U5J98_10920 [Halobacteriales archaeon]|nr:hypothetical protein [Halobacteriales archaeon]
MIDFASFVLVSKLAVLTLGAVVVRLAYLAYRRTGSRALRALAIAFGLITLGGALGGGVDQLLEVGLEAGVLINSALTAAGFAVLAYSLYVSEDPTTDD